MIYEQTFRVRYYECDAQGWMHPAAYLRYMQEAAFAASAAMGYDLARYEAMGCYWLVRETEAEVLRPLRYNDVVQVQTWVADFRRVRSIRAYEFRLARSGALAVRAQTDWAFLDRAAGRPTAIPATMKAAFFPQGAPPTLPRRRFPAAPPPPDAFWQRRRVEWQDLDQAGHVNNAVYLAYVEDCAVRCLTARGWPPSRLAAEGLALLTRRLRIEYRLPALLDDELALATWLADGADEGRAEEGRAAAVLRHCALTRPADGALLARSRTWWGAHDLATGEPLPLPEGLVGTH